jgi:hypothetical protein
MRHVLRQQHLLTVRLGSQRLRRLGRIQRRYRLHRLARLIRAEEIEWLLPQ